MTLINIRLIRSSLLLFLSLSLAYFILRSDLIKDFLLLFMPVMFLSEILAGMLYSSFFTSPISLAMLIVLAERTNPIILALVAGAGAVLGDLVIVRFLRSKFAHDFSPIYNHPAILFIDRVMKKFKLTFLYPVLGAIIIASPLPDEVGLLLLGVSDLKMKEIMLLSFTLNSLGILVIVLPINLLS